MPATRSALPCLLLCLVFTGACSAAPLDTVQKVHDAIAEGKMLRFSVDWSRCSERVGMRTNFSPTSVTSIDTLIYVEHVFFTWEADTRVRSTFGIMTGDSDFRVNSTTLHLPDYATTKPTVNLCPFNDAVRVFSIDD